MGKTYLGALIGATYILAGGVVTHGMPTMQQGKTILFRRTEQMISQISRGMKRGVMKPVIDQTIEKVYANHGQMRVISTDKDAQKEGYTTDLLIIDEGHRNTEEIIGVCEPFLAHAKRRKTAKAIILGVGGHTQSLIEKMKRKGYASLRITPDDILPFDPTWEPVFADFKQTMTDIEYRQHILCEAVDEGMRRMFGPIAQSTPLHPDDVGKYRETLFFGMDVGRTTDRTCITTMRHLKGFKDLIDSHYDTGPFIFHDGTGQDERIYSFVDRFLWEPDNLCIEINGLGSGLWDILRVDKFNRLKGINLDYNMKEAFINHLTRDIRDGIFRCENREDAEHLESLRFEIKPNGKYEWEHSDLLSSILMSYAAMQQVASYV